MMTKYQLVFVKLETTMHKILSTIEVRKKMRIKKAFYVFRNNALSLRLTENKINNRRRLVLLKFENTLSSFVDGVGRYLTRAYLQEAFAKLKLNY